MSDLINVYIHVHRLGLIACILVKSQQQETEIIRLILFFVIASITPKTTLCIHHYHTTADTVP